MKRKITKKERTRIITTLLLAGGTWFVVSPLKNILANAFSETITFFIGVGIIIFTLWWFNLK